MRQFEGNELFMHIHIRVSITSVMITAFSHKTLKGFLAHQTVLVTYIQQTNVAFCDFGSLSW